MPLGTSLWGDRLLLGPQGGSGESHGRTRPRRICLQRGASDAPGFKGKVRAHAAPIAGAPKADGRFDSWRMPVSEMPLQEAAYAAVPAFAAGQSRVRACGIP